MNVFCIAAKAFCQFAWYGVDIIRERMSRNNMFFAFGKISCHAIADRYAGQPHKLGVCLFKNIVIDHGSRQKQLCLVFRNWQFAGKIIRCLRGNGMIQFFVFLTVDGIFFVTLWIDRLQIAKMVRDQIFYKRLQLVADSNNVSDITILQIQFRKRMQTVRNIFMNQILIIDHIALHCL